MTKLTQKSDLTDPHICSLCKWKLDWWK